MASSAASASRCFNLSRFPIKFGMRARKRSSFESPSYSQRQEEIGINIVAIYCSGKFSVKGVIFVSDSG